MTKIISLEKNTLVDRIDEVYELRKIKLSPNTQIIFKGISKDDRVMLSSVYNEERSYTLKRIITKHGFKKTGLRAYYAPIQITNHKFGLLFPFENNLFQIAITYDCVVKNLDMLLRENNSQTIQNAQKYLRNKFDKSNLLSSLNKAFNSVMIEYDLTNSNKLVRYDQDIEKRLRKYAVLPRSEGIQIKNLNVVGFTLKVK